MLEETAKQPKMQVFERRLALQSGAFVGFQSGQTPVRVVVSIPHLPGHALGLNHRLYVPPRRFAFRAAERHGPIGPRTQGKGTPFNAEPIAETFLQAMEANRRRVTPGSEIV